MVVDTTVEDGRGILANTRVDQCLATRVVLDEITDIVDDAGNRNEGTAILGLLDVVVPADDRELLKRNTPVESGTLLVELLLELLDTTLLDLVRLELLEVVGEAELLPHPDAPLGGIILMPCDGIAVIGRELVVEVVVTFSEGDDGSDEMITGRVAVVEWLVTEPVSKRVDAEGCLLDDENSQNSSVDEATHPVTPSETADEHREDHSHGDHGLDVVAVLPHDNWVLVEISDVGTADTLGVLLHDHPSEMRVQEALADGVWVLVGIGVSVVSAVVPRPPSDGALYGAATHGSKENLERSGCRVRAMSPKTMVACVMLVGCSTRTNFKSVKTYQR